MARHATMFSERLGGLAAHFSLKPGHGPTCVLLHGFGAPGTDLVGLHRAINAPPDTSFVFPEAPLKLDFLPDARAWWLIDMFEYQSAVMRRNWADIAKAVPEGLAEARTRLIEFLAALEQNYGVDRTRLVLGGFSQGAMLACDVTLHTTEPLAGLVVMSGGLIAEEIWMRQLKGRTRAGLRVFQTHGVSDPVVPYQGGEMLRQVLMDSGLDVTFQSFEGGHGVPPDALLGIGRLLSEC